MRFSLSLARLMRRVFLEASLLLIIVMLAWAADGAWLARVPVRDHDRSNPYRGKPEAIAAGRRIFLDHCAQCHGGNAEGTEKRPPLRSDRVQQQATEGDLHWLLVNGNMMKSMPSWAKLPDPQLWQVISYVKSLHE